MSLLNFPNVRNSEELHDLVQYYRHALIDMKPTDPNSLLSLLKSCPLYAQHLATETEYCMKMPGHKQLWFFFLLALSNSVTSQALKMFFSSHCMCSSLLTLCPFCSEQKMFQYSLSFSVFSNIRASLYPVSFFPVVIDGSSAWCCPAWVFTECTWLQANLVVLKVKNFKPVSNTEDVSVLPHGYVLWFDYFHLKDTLKSCWWERLSWATFSFYLFFA